MKFRIFLANSYSYLIWVVTWINNNSMFLDSLFLRIPISPSWSCTTSIFENESAVLGQSIIIDCLILREFCHFSCTWAILPNENIHSFWALIEEHWWVNHKLLSNKSKETFNFVSLLNTKSVNWCFEFVWEEKFIVNGDKDSIGFVIKSLSVWKLFFIIFLKEDVHCWIDSIMIFLFQIWS